MEIKADAIKEMITYCKTEKQIVAVLNKNGIPFHNDTEEYGYINIKVPTGNGYIRIYKAKREIKVQTWTPCKMEYSGVPTFFGTNSCF